LILLLCIIRNEFAGPYWRRLVFNLAFFHAVIHERKKFGALGWNLSYEFNQSDLEVAVLELESLVRRSKDQIPPFDVFCYLAGSVIYGGRVTDEFDRRRLLRIIERFYCPETLKEDYSYAGDEAKSFVLIFIENIFVHIDIQSTSFRFEFFWFTFVY
jgi:hypothetical protein